MEDINDIKTQLLTLLNVSASKRQTQFAEDTPSGPATKKRTRKNPTPPPEPPQSADDEKLIQVDEEEVHSDHEQDS